MFCLRISKLIVIENDQNNFGCVGCFGYAPASVNYHDFFRSRP